MNQSVNESVRQNKPLEIDSPSVQPAEQARAAAIVAEMDAKSTKFYTPCGNGRMIWRRWGSGTPLVLVHGGGGAWSHWIRNIGPLAERYTVWALDTPGLGESDLPPEPVSMDAICEIVHRGTDMLIPEGSVDVMGFSLGGPIATSLAAHLGPRLRNLVLAASRYVPGFKRVYPELVSWRKLEDPVERLAGHRRNLELMMLAYPENIDALAVYIQSVNTPRGRIYGKRINPGTKLLECLQHARPQGRVTGICGRDDQAAKDIMGQQEAGLHAVQPNGRFHVIEHAGHWIQYEAADRFNELALAALAEPVSR